VPDLAELEQGISESVGDLVDLARERAAEPTR